MSRMMSTGSTPRIVHDDVLAVGREEVVLRARGAGGADLGGLLAEARRPEGELALPLQVGRLAVERAHHDHVAVEALELGVGERVDDRQVGLGGRRRGERAVRREDAHEFGRQSRLGGVASERGHRSTLARARSGPLGGRSDNGCRDP